ncbi:alanine dehydrogenase [Litorivivens sp.]|uniref:alanine dehydrogenase n=1 Tax=Litorivivens sp. TaxID=2020868 RepID=UPI0035677446
MKIGVPTEIKPQEYRVALMPEQVALLCKAGHSVCVQRGAGEGSGFLDKDYRSAGATIVDGAQQLFDAAELIVKVKEPQPEECARLRAGHVLFTYLHLAPDRALVDSLLDSGATAIAYETVRDESNRLPLLFPMSEIAGRVAAQAAARCLEKPLGGSGILLGGATGVEPAKTLILGGGVVGVNAGLILSGMGAQVTVLDSSETKRAQLAQEWGRCFQIGASDAATLGELLPEADVVIGAVLVPGDASPKLIRRRDLARMKSGAVLVDVAIDQGGCFESSRPTTHAAPSFIEQCVVHYCVANIPGAVPRTATAALSRATFPYIQALADKGWKAAMQADPGLASGLSVCGGRLVCPAVARAQARPFVELESVLA